MLANGGGHAVEAVLVQLGQQAAGTALNTVDVAPTSPSDPNGLVEFYCVAFLGIGAAAGAMLLARILGPVSHLRGALKRLGLMTVHTALLSAAITLFTDVVYGALAGHFWFLFLTLWLYVVAVCLAITGLAALAWVLRNPAVSAPIVGATKPHHLAEATAALELKLTGNEVAMLEKPYSNHGPSWY